MEMVCNDCEKLKTKLVEVKTWMKNFEDELNKKVMDDETNSNWLEGALSSLRTVKNWVESVS